MLLEISAVVDILLSHGADAAQRSPPRYVTPLHCAAHIYESLQPDMFVVIKTALQQLFVQLCRDGGAPCVNAVDAYGVPVLVHLLVASRRWVTSTGGMTVGRAFIPFLTHTLQHFLRRGLNPNAPLTMWAQRGASGRVVITSSYYREIVALISAPAAIGDSQFYGDAHRLLVILAQRGGNPNLVGFYMPTQSGDDGQLGQQRAGIDDASISCLLARVVLGRQDSLALAGALATAEFFYKTLLQGKLKELGDGVRHYVASDPRGCLSPASRAVVNRLAAGTPRPLRLLCRIAIADSVDWRLAKRCPTLPLPKALLQYLVNFDL
jgi:hypothetical protein